MGAGGRFGGGGGGWGGGGREGGGRGEEGGGGGADGADGRDGGEGRRGEGARKGDTEQPNSNCSVPEWKPAFKIKKAIYWKLYLYTYKKIPISKHGPFWMPKADPKKKP